MVEQTFGWEAPMISIRCKIILLIVSIAAATLSGCWSLNPLINPNRLLAESTTVEITGATKIVLFNSAVARDQQSIDTMIKRVIELTRAELTSLDIEAYTLPAPGSAKLNYEIRTVDKVRDKFEVTYQVIFENSEGKRIFVDTDKEVDRNIDALLEKIAIRTARNVQNCFKNE